jgi:poly(3-hydroxybutyrate) depolymerase
MNPDRHLNLALGLLPRPGAGDDERRRSHRKFYDEYNAVLDMPAEYYLDTIKTVFQDLLPLVNGTW